MKFILQVMLLCLSTAVVAQTQISGTVADNNGQPVPGASIVLDTTTGTVTDFDGNFTLNTSQTPPFTITVSSVGLETKSVTVSSAAQALSITLGASSTQLDEIVVSASRMAERIFESPVTVEKFSLQQIERTPAADYFNGLANLKGVNLVEAGLVFNQVQIRGFSDIYNEGLVTLVDGMNNQMPVFGFAVGNLIGLNELDVQSVELVPGAASALYGADAYKGIMFLNSKNPFDHQGISVKYKQGVTEQDTAGSNEFTDFAIRMATKIGDKWAVKATLSHKQGTDWSAQDYRHSVDGNIIDGYATNAPDYNAVNEEGEIAFSTPLIFDQLVGVTGNPAFASLASVSPNFFGTILSTGYNDVDMFGSETFNTKGNFAVHFRPNDNTEISIQSLLGTGSAPLSTGGTRYHMDNVKIQQHKVELQSGGLTSRFYYTKEDAGDTLVAQLMSIALAQQSWGGLGIQDGWGINYLNTYLGAIGLNEYPLSTYGAQYAANPLFGVGALLTGVATQIQTVAGTYAATGGQTQNPATYTFEDYLGYSTQPFHDAARGVANTGLLVPGTPEFDAAFETASNISADNLGSGARIIDVSKIYNYEADYDFGDKFDFGQLIVGANLRHFNLNTQGTLYTDYDKPIEYQEYGAYAQLKKNLFDDFVTLTGSIRYDEQTVLDSGNFTPRLGLLFNLNENQNIRLSAQQGFRNPTNQDKFIGYSQGAYTILGSAQSSIERFRQTVDLRNGNEHQFTGQYVLDNAVDFSSSSAVELNYVKPEVVTMLELGYRFNSPGLTLDVSAYYSNYQDKIAGKFVNAPVFTNASTGDTYADAAAAVAAGNFYGFQVDSNLEDEFNAYGVSLEAIKTFSSNFSANLVYEYNQFDYDQSTGVDAFVSWNTPDHRIKGGFNYSLGALNLTANARYNSEYFYESSFFSGTIQSNTILDAKLTISIPQSKYTFEVGGNNIGGNNYVSLPGSGMIGSVYYAGLRVDL